MNSYTTFLGFYALSNTQIWLSSEDDSLKNQILIYVEIFVFLILVSNFGVLNCSYNSFLNIFFFIIHPT